MRSAAAERYEIKEEVVRDDRRVVASWTLGVTGAGLRRLAGVTSLRASSSSEVSELTINGESDVRLFEKVAVELEIGI